MSESTPHSEHVERLHIALSWVPKAHYPEARDALNGLEEQLGAAHDEINERSDSQALMLGKLKELQEQLEAFRAALETIAQPMPETDGDWGATYDWHKSAIARRDIARAALALASSPASEPEIEWVPVTVVNEHGEKVGPQGMWRPKEQAE